MEFSDTSSPRFHSHKVIGKHIYEDEGTFIDREFPPSDGSLHNKTNSKLHVNELKIWRRFVWKRPTEFMPGEPQLFVGDIDPSDIVEGYLGNFYFLSAVRALAENPANIKRLFDIKKADKEGQYIVNLSLNGENYKIEIDDYIPYYEKAKKPAFSYSKTNELWVMLLEKAWAKVCGSYENSIMGLCCESFRALTGAPVEYITHAYIQEVWKSIMDAYNNGYTMCALAERESMVKTKAKENDLFSAYAYSIIKVHEYEVEDGSVRLLKVRNQGNTKWLKRFHENSNVHKQELKEKTGTKPGDDSTLLISIEDYLCYFKSTLICKNNEHMSSSSMRCKHAFGDSTMLRISVSNSEKVSFTVSQFNQKFVGRDESLKGSFIRFILAREKDHDELEAKRFPIKYIDGVCGFEEYSTITCDCKTGDYIAYVEILGVSKGTNNFVFRTYSEDVPLVEEIKNNEKDAFLHDVMKSMARDRGERKTYDDKGEPDIFRCLKIDEDKTKLGYLYYENNSKDSTLKEEVVFEHLDGVVILGHPKQKKLHIEVGPGENKIYVLNQVEKQYLMKCDYFTSVQKSMESLEQLVRQKGEKKQIKFDGITHDIYYYVYDDGDGYVWMYENLSEDIIFEGTFFYTLNNLRIANKEANGGSEWHVKLKPKERSYMRMDTIDITQTWGYKCKCSFHCADDISTEDKVLEKVLAKGEKQQALCHGLPIDVFYYICFINEKYMWYFVNKTDSKFSGTFKFYMENLKIEGDEDEKPRSQFDIFLKPGETCLKTMVQIDPYKNSKYDCSYACDLL